MKNIFFKLLLFSTLSFSISSCITHYIPPPVNNPMLSSESEIQVSASASMGTVTGMTNFNLAYSPIQHLGLGFTYNSYSADLSTSTNGSSRTDKLYKGRYNELLAGYYRGFAKHGLLELYTGMGIGSTDYNYVNYLNTNGSDGESKLSHYRIFLMPAVGFKFKNFQISYGLKLSHLNYYKIGTSNINNSFLLDEINDLGLSPFLFLDNAITTKFGSKNLQAFIQLSTTTQVTGNFVTYDPTRLTLGLQFQFFAQP